MSAHNQKSNATQLQAKRNPLERLVEDWINNIYMDELIFRIVNKSSKDRLIQIIRKIQSKSNIQGVILGGTELPLILNSRDLDDLEVFDTTQIHVNAILDMLNA